MGKRVVDVCPAPEGPGVALETCLMLVELGVRSGAVVELRLGRMRATFPTLSMAGNIRFARVLRVIGVVATHLRGRQGRETLSKRGIYYMDVGLFVKQKVVDDVINALLFCLKVSMEELGVRAVEKGLYSVGGGMARLIGNETEVPHGVKQLVVVEKEAVFTNLIWTGARADTLYVTGKGYPDKLTMDFVQRAKNVVGCAECVVDCDVYGILIAGQYGLEPSRPWRLLDEEKGFLPNTSRDVAMLLGTIKRMTRASVALRECQRQLFLCVKREVDIGGKSSGGCHVSGGVGSAES